MRTWEDYKNHVKGQSLDEKENMERIEELSAIIGKMIIRREELGMSQRDLAKKCGITQSALARLESCRTTPQLDTMLKVLKPLGLTLSVTPTGDTSQTRAL